ncbi:hypothetical protein N665_0220s0021 [Sinapis alba]|nr:hypothetical protein N665_0220s0021 [Sinapis alba]
MNTNPKIKKSTSILFFRIFRKGRGFVGVPKNCWCGESVVPVMSKSNHNPYRRYFRCVYAATKKLENDEHKFKWIDEAILEELESLQCKNARIEEEVKEIARERLVLENLQMKAETEVVAKVEEVLAEEKTKMKKMMVFLVIGCAIVVVSMVLLCEKKW